MAKNRKSVSVLAKLTPEQAELARTLYFKKKLPQVAIAEKLHVSQSAISHLVRGQTYRRVA